eukprot:CAMPEP_0182875610 /NCGR_PEP_ID=MMETSP0034_2-20130328/13646_1 /TAXON_ID=156128 /ORGANISM="Nephroselmis pyriformis, Strain CCMP717" /LENGTH=118 /DNA_ID=CAMNT_0025008357 /DNA_START=151 /DNA_END=504 /DNA_ORIENTATION=-
MAALRASGPSLLHSLFRRQDGTDPPLAASASIVTRRVSGMALSRDKEMAPALRGGITWLDVDLVEARYLLAGATDASVAVYDTLVADDPAGDSSGKAAGCFRDVAAAGAPAGGGLTPA